MSPTLLLDEPTVTATDVVGPGESDHYEIIDGVRVELPPMSAESSVLAARLARLLGNFGVEAGLGEAYPEVLLKLPLAGQDRSRKPDVAFVPYSRWPRGRRVPATNAWAVLPELCVEVVGPTDKADERPVKSPSTSPRG